VVFQHGIFGGHLQALPLVNEFVKKGFVVASMDLPYHGSRAFCAKNSDCEVQGGGDGVCTPDPAKAGQGDTTPPGTCTTGTLRPDATGLTTVASGNYFISANFFRTRDGIRQADFDHAALALALARPPSPYPNPPLPPDPQATTANPLVAALASKGIAVDPTKVFYVGLSLGSIIGTQVVAVNPRYSEAVLNVPGGTVYDIVTHAPAFQTTVAQLFAAPPLSIDVTKVTTDPATAAKYAQYSIIAKWVLDPAEPINYAGNVKTKVTPNLHTSLGPLTSTTTAALGQLANSDTVVPNFTTVDASGKPVGDFGGLLLADAGLTPFLYTSESAANNCVSHGFLIDLSSPATTLDAFHAQDDAANFLADGATVPATNPVVLP
jgi:hypothetical protein